jgi:OHCU decarboxylase
MPDAPAATTAEHNRAVAEFNGLPDDRAQAALRECCAAGRWVNAIVAGRPYASVHDLRDRAERAFDALADDDWREAFAAHARIGQRRDDDARGSAEQAGAASATAEHRAALAEANERYEDRFGHVFLIRARGRDAGEMLAALQSRLANPPEVELAIAADQQREITRLRIDDLLSGA